eukprot:TRINITY_DN185_c0_g1_i2.p3 TRINITY_DN185_c0_g1~~TRINITY_DN185_c0_g1_i2.p3  ORF type:complete len:166 (-),score=30.60 TRINITY_DN185_c0_g1_i2:987-1484(-)
MASPDRDNRFGDRRLEDSPRGRSPRGGSRSPMRRSSRSPRGRSPSPRGNANAGKMILHVSGLSQRTRDIDLENRFAKYGKVIDCKVVRDKRSGMGRGYAFVTMENDQAAEESINALNKSEFEGHTISVERVCTAHIYIHAPSGRVVCSLYSGKYQWSVHHISVSI